MEPEIHLAQLVSSLKSRVALLETLITTAQQTGDAEVWRLLFAEMRTNLLKELHEVLRSETARRYA